jgi:hypothetical protein
MAPVAGRSRRPRTERTAGRGGVQAGGHWPGEGIGDAKTRERRRQAGSVLGVAIFGSLVAGDHFIPGFHAALITSI